MLLGSHRSDLLKRKLYQGYNLHFKKKKIQIGIRRLLGFSSSWPLAEFAPICQYLSGSEWHRVVSNSPDASHSCWKEGITFLILLAMLPSTGGYLPLLWCPFGSSRSASYHQDSQDLLCFLMVVPTLFYSSEREQDGVLVSVPLRGTGFTHSSRHYGFSTQSASLLL